MSAILKEDKQQDWKNKYYEGLDELDEKQKQWEQDENNLTKSILKLAFSYTGFNQEMDQQLTQLRNTLRKNKDADDRRQVLINVVDNIVAEAEKKPGNNENQIPSPLINLFDQLKLDDQYQLEIEQIKKKLKKDSSDNSQEKFASQLASIVNELSEKSKHVVEDQAKPAIEVKPVDGFDEFINRLSLPGEAGTEIMQLRKRAKGIKEEKQRLDLIDETVQLLIKAYRPGVVEDLNKDDSTNINEVLLQLLEWVSFPSDFKQDVQKIKEKLNNPIADKDLSKSLREVSSLISLVNKKLQEELDEIESYLSQVLKRLKEVEMHLLKTEQVQSLSYADAQELNKEVQNNAKKLRANVENSKDIEHIKSSLDAHLEFIHSNLDGYLEKEKTRYQESEQRVKVLNKRLGEMETETKKLKNAIEEERQKAHKDTLTLIPNRLAYEEKMQQEYERWQRHGHNLTLAVIDIDKFKNVNDTYGHKAGDKVLKTVADLCTKHIRKIDFIARYGGEEFVLLFPDTALVEAKTAAEHLRSEVEKCNFHYNNEEVPVTISMGLAEFRGKDDPEEVFKRADKALYAAKESGRNRCLDEKELDL